MSLALDIKDNYSISTVPSSSWKKKQESGTDLRNYPNLTFENGRTSMICGCTHINQWSKCVFEYTHTYRKELWMIEFESLHACKNILEE